MLTTAKTQIIINGMVKGDPSEEGTLIRGPFISPLFVLIADGLNNMLRKMDSEKLIQGLPDCTISTHINLQYMDDVLIFERGDVRESIYIKWVLCCFEAWLGLKNYLLKGEKT